MDKYYMLVRRFVNASFRLLLREEWAQEASSQYNDILTQRGGPLWQVPLLRRYKRSHLIHMYN